MDSSLFLLVCVLLVGDGLCHLCLFSPPQRGSMQGINEEAADDCALISGPCGGRLPVDDNSVLYVEAGKNFTVIFQKNLDHYADGSSPGNMTVFLITNETDEERFYELGHVLDKGEPSLYVYSLNVTMPFLFEPGTLRFTLQVTYQTNRTPVFHQCGDMGLFSVAQDLPDSNAIYIDEVTGLAWKKD